MKAQDVVLQLATKLPTLTPEFTDNATVTSLTASGGTATAVTSAAHGFLIGQVVIISGAQTPISIAITRSGLVATAVTTTDHDLTEFVPIQVEIADATDANFNGLKKLLSVPNRRTFTFQVADTGLTTDSGNILNGSSAFNTYNGIFSIATAPTTTSFTYTLGINPPPAQGTIIAAANARISASVTAERAIEAYSKQGINEFWLFVVLEGVIASKNRNILSDAVDNQQRQSQGNDFRQQIIQPVSLFVIIPTTTEIAAREAGDTAQDLFQPICQSILFERFDSGLFTGKYNPLQFTGHNFFEYNTAFYVHQYSFEQVADIQFEDTVGRNVDVAFRDLNITINQTFGVEQLTANINLDDVPL